MNLIDLAKKIDSLLALIKRLSPVTDKAILNADEAADYLCISKSTLYKHTSSGKLPFFKLNGKLLLFSRQDLDRWIEKNRFPSNDELQKTI